jgi:signal transduction histidine kinase
VNIKRRTSVRFRLTVAYSGLFVTAFGAVLGVSYLLVADRTGGSRTAVSVICSNNGQSVNASFSIGQAPLSGPTDGSTSGGYVGAVPTPGGGISCAQQVVQASSGDVLFRTGNQGATPQDLGLPQPVDQLTKAVNASRDRTLQTILIEALVALGLMAVISVGLGWWMSGRALRPVHRITEAARRLSGRTLHDRINLDGPNDELKELADTFDDMLSRLDQAFTSQRRFVANASHELRTPIATERVLLDEALADHDASADDLRTILEQLRVNNEESEQLINALLALARSERGIDEWSTADLAEAAETAVVRASSEAVTRGVDISVEVGHTYITGDTGLLERLAGNLVDNAVRHNHPGGWVRVETGATDDGGYLAVSNSGPVIDPGIVATLLEPFCRGTGERHSTQDGFGLGLSIVDAIVSSHGGRLSLRARPEGGLEARVDFRSVAVAGAATSNGALGPLIGPLLSPHR